MEYIVVFLVVLVLIIFTVISLSSSKYDSKGFDKNGRHKNGTKYDSHGYNYSGYDINGYNRYGYNIHGRNAQNQYNRYYDIADFKTSIYSADGFMNPKTHPIALTDHARQRMYERMSISNMDEMDRLAAKAYQYGKSARQIKKSSVPLVREIENRHDNSVVLIYKNYIYIFSRENVLITVYENERIPVV